MIKLITNKDLSSKTLLPFEPETIYNAGMEVEILDIMLETEPDGNRRIMFLCQNAELDFMDWISSDDIEDKF